MIILNCSMCYSLFYFGENTRFFLRYLGSTLAVFMFKL